VGASAIKNGVLFLMLLKTLPRCFAVCDWCSFHKQKILESSRLHLIAARIIKVLLEIFVYKGLFIRTEFLPVLMGLLITPISRKLHSS
jgi:F0F1-type ATP synthase assembly protein I